MDTQLRGWRTFAGIIFYLVGVQRHRGLAAIFKEEFFLVDGEKLLVTDYTAWGWFLFLGLVQLIAGAGILKNRGWARLVGVALAMMSAVRTSPSSSPSRSSGSSRSPCASRWSTALSWGPIRTKDAYSSRRTHRPCRG